MNKVVDLVIPVFFKDAKKVKRFLHSISKERSFDISYKIFLVLNPSDCKQLVEFQKTLSAELPLPCFISLHFISSEIPGVNRARQLGYNQGQSEIVFFFDADVELFENALIHNHAILHDRNSDVFAYGGGYVALDTASRAVKAYVDLQQNWLMEGLIDHSKQKSAYLLGGNFSIKRSVMNLSLLSFDEKIVFGSSETDFFLESLKKNLILVRTPFSVIHNCKDSFFKICKKMYMQGQGKAYIESKKLTFSPKYVSIAKATTNLEFVIQLFYKYFFSLGYHRKNKSLLQFCRLQIRLFFVKLSQFRQKILNIIRQD